MSKIDYDRKGDDIILKGWCPEHRPDMFDHNDRCQPINNDDDDGDDEVDEHHQLCHPGAPIYRWL